jgi:hypothetical protein
MARSNFARTSFLFRTLSTLAIFAVVAVIVVSSQRQFETQAQQNIKPSQIDPKVRTGSEVLIELAIPLGQSVPAKRLIDYKQKYDAKGQQRYWAIVDFSQSSTNKRLFIFDTVEKKVDKYYVSHGRGSEGANDDGMAEIFLNEDGSLSSSLGIYRGLDEYVGKHGRSLRLEGLESTNSNALSRDIILHTADYVSADFIRQTGRLGRYFIRQTGRLGRSEGCFAVEQSVGDLLIDRFKNGSYIIAWKK